MKWYLLLLVCLGRQSLTDAACSAPVKFYVDCGQTRTASAALQFCQTHQMTLVNLTNGTSTLTSDITLLNATFVSKNCAGYFWFSSGSQTGLVVSMNNLGDLLGALLSGVLNLILCLIPFLCPVTTTAAPITSAFTVCTRSTQQRLIQKCSLIQKPNIQQYRFNQQTMGAGILSVFAARSQMACGGLCSSNAECIGISYQNGMCSLYM
jgi:hypothetical protein